jgi:hypothetical protein
MNKVKDMVESIYGDAMFDYHFDVTCEATVNPLEWRLPGVQVGDNMNGAARRFELSFVALP